MSLPRVGERPVPAVFGADAFEWGEKAHAADFLQVGLDTYERDAARAFEQKVRDAARKAHAAYAGKARKCYKTTAKFMALMGVPSAIHPSTSSRGLPLAHLARLIELGKLKPGMQIYVCRRPGTDPASLNLGNRPHWAIYVGKDEQGVPRFMDQYRDNWTLAEFIAEYGHSRKIDTIFDPLRARRPEVSVDGAESQPA